MGESETERPLRKVADRTLKTEEDVEAALKAIRSSASGTIAASNQIIDKARKKLENE